jgi:AcrR family transcriptional regulator
METRFLNESRSYKSPSRKQAKSETRAAILEAVVEVIIEQGLHAFTIQNVAEAAGVSHRTVYRHFDSREALLDGLQDLIQEQADRVGLPVPQDVSRALEMVGPLFEEFYRMGDAMHASVIAATALGYQTHQQRGAIDYLYRVLRKSFVHLPEVELRDAAAIFRTIVNHYTWYVLAINHKLPASDCARATTWAVRVLIEDIERRDRACSKRRSPVPPQPTKTRASSRPGAKRSQAEATRTRHSSTNKHTNDTP